MINYNIHIANITEYTVIKLIYTFIKKLHNKGRTLHITLLQGGGRVFLISKQHMWHHRLTGLLVRRQLTTPVSDTFGNNWDPPTLSPEMAPNNRLPRQTNTTKPNNA